MPPQPGETSLLTLYADVHYYFGPPTAKPPHHRFDKASYVYIYERPSSNVAPPRARLEIANSAGTPDQDAFNGALDNTRAEYTYKHSSLVTLVVDGGADRPAATDGTEWHLMHWDQHNENRYLFRLHTLDLYFHSPDDALSFLSPLERLLPGSRLSITKDPSTTAVLPAHDHAMSPVVQQLEKAAISERSYVPESGSISDTSITFPGPPTAHPAAVPTYHSSMNSHSTTDFPGPPSGTAPSAIPTSFAPMAYNPAAPAAPEPIAHREKTPPPPDAASGTGLAEAAASDFAPPPLQHSGTFPLSPQQSYFAGPPHQPAPNTFGGVPSSGSPYSGQNQTVPYAPSPLSTSSGSAPPSQPYGGGMYPQHLQQQQPYGHQGYGAAAAAAPPPPQPPLAYSNYSYAQQQGQQPVEGGYGIHQQVYRPTEDEASAHGHGSKTKIARQPTGKLEVSAQRVDRGVGGFLKRLEKKIG